MLSNEPGWTIDIPRQVRLNHQLNIQKQQVSTVIYGYSWYNHCVWNFSKCSQFFHLFYQLNPFWIELISFWTSTIILTTFHSLNNDETLINSEYSFQKTTLSDLFTTDISVTLAQKNMIQKYILRSVIMQYTAQKKTEKKSYIQEYAIL